METQEVTLHNELKHKSIFLRDFTTAAQMLWQVLHRCFGRCCTDASAGAAQMFRQVLRQELRQLLLRCFGRCCTDASAGAAQVLRQLLHRCFGSCCADASAVAVMKGSTIVHGRKSAYGIAVLRAAYAAGSPQWPAPSPR